MSKVWSRRDFLILGAGLGGGLLAGGLAGCGKKETTPTPATHADAGVPRRGGRLRLGIIDESRAGNLDAHAPIGGGIIRGFALYSKLWEWNEHMTPELALAEEVEINQHATAFTVRLRKGLEFHHGKTISADDVIFSIRRLSDPALASAFAALTWWIDRDNLVKLDERTVRIPIRDGLSYLPLPDGWVNFGGIVPTDYHPVTNPIGAGPYKLKEFTPGQRSLFTRFDNYFKPGLPYADELEIIDFKDQTSRLAALQAGQIDMANAISPDLLVPLKASGRAQIIVSPTHGWQSFDMNISRKPFDDPRVRQAFRLFTDRQELIQRALGGEGRVANDLYSPLDPTFNLAIPQRPYDLERAKALLKEAGVPNLTVELTAGPGGGPSAQVFAEQAKKAGVTINIKQVDPATFGGPHKADWLISTNTRLGGEFLHTAANVDAPIAVVNKSHFSDPRFDTLFRQALGEPDVEKRKPLVHEMQQIQYDRGGLIIWGYLNAVDAVANNVGGVVPEHSHFPTWRFEKIWLRS